MEGFLNLIAGYFGGGTVFPYIRRIHIAYITVRMNPPFLGTVRNV